MIWQHGIQTLILFMDMLNSHYPTIKFTYEYNTKEIAFLDTIVYKTASSQLLTRAYHKPTDNKQYLHFHSVHPRKQKESVLYGLLIRSRRICSEEIYFEGEARNILQQLRHRKYPQDLLEKAYRKVSSMDKQDLLRPSVPKDNSKLRLITNFNPNNPDLRSFPKNMKIYSC